MLFHVPQFIDIEDRIVGPLTWKQLGWMVGMGVILMIIWNLFEFAYFVLISIPIVMLFLALAFYKPYGLTLASMIYYAGLYFLRSKKYTWHRETKAPIKSPKKSKVSHSKNKEPDVISIDQLRSIADTLDDPESSLRSRK